MYLLFIVDFDEGESSVEHIKDLDELESYFDDKEFVNNLLENGEHIGEWWNYHLVEIN